MSGQDESAQLAEAVAALGQAMGGIAAILEQHGRMLQRLPEMAAKPEEDTPLLEELSVALIDRLDRQAGILERMEARFGQIGAAVDQSAAAVARG